MKNKVYITSDQNKLTVTPAIRGLIRRAIGSALKYEGFDFKTEVSVTLTDNDGIRELNCEYRKIDKATDVLSFPIYGAEDIALLSEADEPICLGDIVISLERAAEQAVQYGHSFERETAFLCVHSVLHLLGYDHEIGKEQEEEMFRRQEEILKKMKLTRE